MATSLIPQALTSLLDLFDDALDIKVFDGPPGRGKDPLEGLYVGATDDDFSIPFQQRWAGHGHIARDEAFEVPNLLYVASGSKGFAPLRVRAFGYLATLENLLRATPTLGIATNSVRAAFGTAGEVRQFHSQAGETVRIRFTINVEGRI